MRRKYITSHYQLPALALCLLISQVVNAKSKEKDTEIICFAAQSKWICAPADQQELANQKAQKLLDKKKSELNSSDVVIKSINIPKFETQKTDFNEPLNTNPIKKINDSNLKNNQSIVKPTSKTDNPYAKLWAHQLIGLSTPNSAVKFVKQNNLDKNEILIIKSTRANMDWWIVLYGLYSDTHTGLDNAANLPEGISDAWLRPLKNLIVNGFIEKF
jgi:septal ring-binding cell division protein DamX